MSNSSVLSNPGGGLDEKYVEFVNNSSSIMYDGDVIVKDIAGMVTLFATSSTDVQELGNSSTTLGDRNVLGVVRCKDSAGVPIGGRGMAMVRGFHPGVRYTAGVTVGTAITPIVKGGTAFAAAPETVTTAAMTFATQQQRIGHILRGTVAVTAAATAKVKAFIDITR